MVNSHLTATEWQTARVAYSKVMGEKRWVESNFELQDICSDIGLQPGSDDVRKALEENEGRLDFEGILRFVQYMKARLLIPEPPDIDTIRAFAAVGGDAATKADVDPTALLRTCEEFDLTIQLQGLLDTDSVQGSLKFNDFHNMFHGSDQPATKVRLKLGYDYNALLEKEMTTKSLPLPRYRRPTDLLRSPATRRASTAKCKVANDKVKYYLELKEKGVNPGLYNEGETSGENVVNATKEDGKEKTDGTQNMTKKKQKKMQEPPKSSPHTILGKGTRVIGRSGLFVDDPPRLYPQHLAATSVPPLPPINQHGRKKLNPVKSTLSSIEKRMAELTKRKLGAKYSKVQPRVNLTGSVVAPKHVESVLAAQ